MPPGGGTLCTTVPRLNRSPSSDKVDEEYHQRDHQQQVNEAARDVEDPPAEQPRYQQDYCKPYQHGAILQQ